MKKINLFCFGFGQVAENFVKKILEEKIHLNLYATTTKKSHFKKIKDLKFESFELNNDKFDKHILNKIESSDYILSSIPPTKGEDPAIKILSKASKKKKFKWITYLSATSVYGDHKGEWVNEKSATKPTSPNGLSRLEAENIWKNLSHKNSYPLQIFRLAGIYSNEFNILKRLKAGRTQLVDKKNHFFSRIHVEDIANILLRSLDNFKNNEIYNICDDKPASQIDVVAYGAKLLKLEQPHPLKLEEVESEMLQNFYKDSKKVDNKKMKIFFKYNLKFPTYVEGLDYIFNNNV